MRFAFAALSIALLAAFAAVPLRASVDERTLPYACSDTVVVATVADDGYGPAESTGNLLGVGWISASLQVRNVVRGEPLPAVLPVRYFAQTAMRRNEDFMLVLKHTATGYEIQDGEMMREQPVLASRCR